MLYPLNELYQSSIVSMQSKQLWKKTNMLTFEQELGRLLYIVVVHSVIYLCTTVPYFPYCI